MKTKLLMGLLVIGLLSLVSCGPSAQTPAEDYGEAQPLVDKATADLAGRLDISTGEIEVLEVEETDFPDASLGVPEPGQMYAQVITPGYIIELAVGDTVYEYHASGDRVVLVPEE